MNRNDRWLEVIQIIIIDILHHWRSIILVTLLSGIIADMALTFIYQPKYESEATFAIKNGEQYAVSNQTDSISDIASAFGYIISSNVFKQDLMDEMKLNSLDGYFETSEMEGTNIIRISAVSSSPRTSYYMMLSMLNRYQDLSQLVLGNVNIELMKNISIPENPINPNSHMKNLVSFGSVGFMAMIALLSLFGFMNDMVKVKEDMEPVGISYLGSLSKERKWYYSHGIKRKKTILISQLTTSFRFIEDIKKIRVQVERKCEKQKWKTILVTSCLENEGKSSVLSNLALALSSNHKKVLLMDGDMRKPALHKIFDLQSNDGMYRLMEGKASLNEAVIHEKRYNVDLLLGHSSFSDAVDRFDEKRMKQLLSNLKQHYDYILLDSVPSALFSDAIETARLCDACLLVVRQDFISIKVISDTLDKLHVSRIPVLGYVLNQKLPSWWRRVSDDRYELRYGRYGYGYGQRRNADGK